MKIETIGNATLYLGDCLEILPTLPKVDAVVTDQPYSPHVHRKTWQSKALTESGDRRASSAHAGIDFAPLSLELAAGISAYAAANCAGWFLAFCDLEGIAIWREAVTAHGLEYVRTCIWDKVDSSPQFTGDRPANSAEAIVCAHPAGRKQWNGGGRRNVFRHASNAEKGSKPHPTTKPTPLMEELVGLFSQPDSIVCDPCMGSGSTGVACANLGRAFIGVEQQSKYFDIACERIKAAQDQLRLFA